MESNPDQILSKRIISKIAESKIISDEKIKALEKKYNNEIITPEDWRFIVETDKK